MTAPDRTHLARSIYEAFAAADRQATEALLADDFHFSSPPDPHLDRDGYFARCWPGAGTVREFTFVREVEHGDEVLLTYEATRADGTRFRNTEVLTFAGERIIRAEVYFGWELDREPA
jgi:ketosteroid isomerase-like protein